MIIINTIDDRKFSLNGVQYLKNYITRPAGEKLHLYNCYENGDVLVAYTHYSEFKVNGDTFQSAELLQEALLDVVFARLTLGGSIVQDNKTIRKYFNVGSDDIALETALALINALPTYTVSEIESVLFVSRSTVPQVNGFTPPVFKFKMIGRGKGTYGIGGTQLFKTNLELIYSQPSTSLEDIENDESTAIINYGSIIGQTIDEWLNLHAPIVVQPLSEGYTLLRGSIGAIQKDYLFIGDAGLYGAGETQSTTNDFQLLSDVVASAANTLQQVTNQGNTTTKSVIIKHQTTQEQTQHLSNGRLYQHANGNTVYVEQQTPIVPSVKYTIPAKESNDKFVMMSDLADANAALDLQSITDSGNTTNNDVNINVLGINDPINAIFQKIRGIDGGISFGNGESSSYDYFVVQNNVLSFGQSSMLHQVVFNNYLLTNNQEFSLPNNSGTIALQEHTAQIVLCDTVDSSPVTGTVSETVLGTCMIPANSPEGIFEVIARIEKTGTAGSTGMKFYINATPDFSGTPVQIAIQTAGSTNLYHRFSREFTLKSGGILQGYNFSATSANDYSAALTPPGSTTINSAINNYLLLAANLGNAADSLKKKSFSITFIRQT